jgi:polysaccharide export outer membrane protein
MGNAKIIGRCLVVASMGVYCSAQQPKADQQAVQKLIERHPAESGLRIEPGDTLSISVFGAPELSQSIRVADDGFAKLPLLGEVRVVSLTEQEAAVALDTAYLSHKLLLHPQTSVTISEFAYTGISISGEVSKPGIYPVVGFRSLVDLIALAGGLTVSADGHVTLQRRDGSIEDAIYLSSQSGAKALLSDTEVHPGDKIIASRAHTIYVLGDVGRPGGYLMQPEGMLTVLQAIAHAEGTSKTAAVNSTLLLRRNGDGVVTTKIALKDLYTGKRADFPLEPNDVLYVPKSTIRSLSTNAPEILGGIVVASIYALQ